MKKCFKQFLQRGLMCSIGGVVIVMIIYGVLASKGILTTLTPHKVITEVLSAALLAFIMGGVSVVHSIERLSLMSASLLHGLVIYVDVIAIYLYNGWLPASAKWIGGFTAIFVLGYLIIWVVIYLSIRRRVNKINSRL